MDNVELNPKAKPLEDHSNDETLSRDRTDYLNIWQVDRLEVVAINRYARTILKRYRIKRRQQRLILQIDEQGTDPCVGAERAHIKANRGFTRPAFG